MAAKSVVGDYVRSVRGFQPDVRLFIVYNLLANVGFGVFQIVFNLYLLKLGMHEDDIGAFSAAQTICMGVGGLALGYLINRHGSWRCVAAGFSVLVVASTLISFAESRFALFLLSALYGFGLAFLFNTTMPFLLEWGQRASRAHAAAVAFSVISLSVTIGSLAGGLLPDLFGALVFAGHGDSISAYRWTLVSGTAIAACGLIPLFLMGQARSGRAPVPETTVAEPTTDRERRQVRADIWLFVAVGGFMSIGVGMVIPFYNVYLTSLGAGTAEIGVVFAVSSAVAAIIGLFAPAISRRFGAIHAVLYLRASIIPFFLLLLVQPVLGIAVIAFMVRQSTFSVAWPIEATFIGELLPPRARASIFGLRSAAWNLVSALAAFLAGKIIVRTGYDIPFASICVFTALSAAMFTLYYRRHHLVSAGAIPSALPLWRGRSGDLVRGAAGATEAAEPTAIVTT
jgi:MFS family permease